MIMEPNYLRSLDFADLKKQYSKSRSKMQKRKERLDKEGFDTNYQRFVNKWGQGGKIPTISSLKASTGNNEKQMQNSMIYIIAELERYAEDESTLISYQKQQRAEATELFNESGYDISVDEYNDFVEFLEWMHNTNLDMLMYTETYESSERGYGRSKRNERTEEEKANVMKLFKEWQENDKQLSEDTIMILLK